MNAGHVRLYAGGDIGNDHVRFAMPLDMKMFRCRVIEWLNQKKIHTETSYAHGDCARNQFRNTPDHDEFRLPEAG